MREKYRSIQVLVILLLIGFVSMPFWVNVEALIKEQNPATSIKEEAFSTVPGAPISPDSVSRTTLANGQKLQEEEDENEPYSEIDPVTLQALKKQPFVAPPFRPNTVAQDRSAEESVTTPPALAPTLLMNFEGLDNLNQPDGLLHRPPDPEIAAGLNHILVVANSSFAIYNKSGALLQEHSFADWFSNVCINCVCPAPDCNFFDPRITYDPLANRWIMLALYKKEATQESKILLSASQTSDPTGSWWNYKLEGVLNFNGENTWADYPDLSFDGITANTGGAIYITTNQFPFISNPPFRTAVLHMLPKASLYSGAGLNYWRASGRANSDGTQAFTLRAAKSFGTPGSEFLINTKSQSNFVSLWKVVPTYPPTSVDWTLQGTINIGSYAVPPNAKQPSCADVLPTIDNRITGGVVWRNNRIYAAFTEANDWGSGTVAAIRYLKINTSTNAIEINQTYGADGFDYFFPAITTDNSENIVFVFARSSPTEFASIRFTGRLTSDSAAQGSAQLKSGQECITGGRWGDYFGVAVDPADSSKVWTYGEWAKILSISSRTIWEWGTWIGQVQFGASSNHPDTIGVYLPSNQTFYLRNNNSPGFADLSLAYGPSGATPIVGDWDGNGTTTIGVYSPGNQTFYLRNSNSAGFADLTIRYGPSGASPIAGDWDGNGAATLGVYDPLTQTFYLRNSNTVGPADLTIRYGPPGGIPIVGDWDGNGTTTIGVYDPTTQTFYLRNSNSPGIADIVIRYGPSGATPVVGDWNGDGTTTIGVYLPSNQTFYLRNSNSAGFADLTIQYGPLGATALSGDWDGL